MRSEIAHFPEVEARFRVASCLMNSAMWGSVTSGLVGLLFAIAGWRLETRGYPNFGRYCMMTWVIFTFVVGQWFVQFTFIERSSVNGYFTPVAIMEISVCFICLIGLCFRQFKPFATAVVLACTFSIVLQVFSLAYWVHGTAQNFSKPLTHFDAFYFALGTFTTAGTGNITPISQPAQGLQALQMGLDFVLLGFVVALVMTRYTNRLDRPQASPGKLSTLIRQAREASSPKDMPSTSPNDMPSIVPPADWSDAT